MAHQHEPDWWRKKRSCRK